MPLAALPGWAVDLIAWAAGLGVLSALALTRPARWLARHLVGDPMTEWLRATIRATVEPLAEQIRAIDHELHPNDGDSMRDQVDRTADQVANLSLQVQEFRRNVDPGIPPHDNA